MACSSPVLAAEDLARAKAYYTEKLGFSVMFESPEAVALELKDGSMWVLYPHERTKASQTVVGFMVDDLAAEMKELRGKGVKFEEYDQPGLKTVDGVAELPGMKSAWFVETEGNILSVGQMG